MKPRNVRFGITLRSAQVMLAAAFLAAFMFAFAGGAQRAYADDLPVYTLQTEEAPAITLKPQASAATDATVDLRVTYGQTEARKMLTMVNAFRTGTEAWAWNEDDTAKVTYDGLAELTYDYNLERVAMKRAAELALSFSHTTLDGQSRAYSELDGYYAWGENIAAGYGTAEDVLEGWKETDYPYAGQGHRRNMLNSGFTAIGIGHAVCNGNHFWVQEFGYPTQATIATAADDSTRTVSLGIASSIVTTRVAEASPESMSLSVGNSKALPTVRGYVGTADTWWRAAEVVSQVSSWTSADASIATISDGKVVAKKVGSTTLTATVPLAGANATVSVSVKVTGNLASATVGKIATVKYNGKAKKPTPVVKFGSTTLRNGTDYKLTYKNNVKAGTATVTVTGVGNYTGKATKTFTIAKAANPMKAKATAKTVKLSKVKKKAQVVKPISFTKKAVGKVTYAKVSGSKKLKVNKSTGKITVQKGTKKGKYTAKVKVSAKGNANYKSVSKTITVKVVVK